MVSVALQAYLNENRLVRTSPLQTLSDTRIGINAEEFLNTELKAGLHDDSLYPPTRVHTSYVENILADRLDQLEELRILPLFVFQGMETAVKAEAGFHVGELADCVVGWDKYEVGRLDQAREIWRNRSILVLCSPTQLTLLTDCFVTDTTKEILKRILTKRKFDFFVAPYSAFCQLTYFLSLNDGTVDSILCPEEALLWNPSRMITKLEMPRRLFHWVDFESVCARLNASPEQIQDAVLLCGSEVSLRFPLLDATVAEANSSSAFETAVEFVKNNHTGMNAVSQCQNEPSVKQLDYVNSFGKSKCAVKYHAVLTKKGNTETLQKEPPLINTHEFFWAKYPDEIYYLLSRGLIPKQTLQSLVSGTYKQQSPWGGPLSPDMRKFLTETLELRTQALHLLSHSLSNWHRNRLVNTIWWNDTSIESPLVHKFTPTLAQEVSKWSVGGRFRSEYVPRSDITLLKLLSVLKNPDAVSKSFAENSEEQKVEPHSLEATEALMTTYYQFYQIRSIISKEHTLTSWGSALLAAIEKLGDEHSSLQIQMYLVFELLQSNVLNVADTEPEETVKDFGSDADHARLISRVVSLVPSIRRNHADGVVAWPTHLSKNLMIFVSCAKSMQETAGELFGMTFLSLYLGGSPVKTEKEADKLKHYNPFYTDFGTPSGLIMLEMMRKRHMQTEPADLSKIRQDITERFSHIAEDVEKTLPDSLHFWDALMVGVNEAEKSGAIGKIKHNLFLEADEWFKAHRC